MKLGQKIKKEHNNTHTQINETDKDIWKNKMMDRQQKRPSFEANFLQWSATGHHFISNNEVVRILEDYLFLVTLGQLV